MPPLLSPSLPPASSVFTHPALQQQGLAAGGGTTLNIHELSPAGLAAWLEEEYEATGLTRRLTHADVQVGICEAARKACAAFAQASCVHVKHRVRARMWCMARTPTDIMHTCVSRARVRTRAHLCACGIAWGCLYSAGEGVSPRRYL